MINCTLAIYITVLRDFFLDAERMAPELVVPNEKELEALDLNDPKTLDLIRHAEESHAADQLLTVREALRKYKKAVFWATFLSASLIMEGYDLVIVRDSPTRVALHLEGKTDPQQQIASFYGQTQFQQRFGEYDEEVGKKVIPPAWQSGLSNSSLVGQIIGLMVNAYCQDKFGARRTMLAFMVWMTAVIAIPCFAPSLPVLAFGEIMCGISWGVFQVQVFQASYTHLDKVDQDLTLQTLSTTYASEIVPTVLRPYVTAYVCMCWGAGILLSAGVVRSVSSIDGDMGWRLPFFLQWVWPVPLFIGTYFAPESPWNAVRRNKIGLARDSLMRLQQDTPNKEAEVEATLAYIRHTTAIEDAETSGASFIECFKGTNLRRTEIVSRPFSKPRFT